MKTRVQIIENSPLHKVPAILISIYRSQFIFNTIPTLLRHRKAHKINLFNSSYIFFTKNSIEAFGGLPNYLLFRSAVQNSNSSIVNKVNIFGDEQLYQYLQKLRFKLGYKILRFSYCNWQNFRNRLGVSRISLMNELKANPQLPKLFVKIDEYIRNRYKKEVDYYQSYDYIQSTPTKYINISCRYFHYELLDIYPMVIRDANTNHFGFICIPALRKKGEVNIQEFISRTSITKQALIKQFFNTGFINKDGKIFRRQQFLFQKDFKPKNILIFHYASLESVIQFTKHPILNNYLQNKNETGVIIHIIQELSLIQTSQFKSLMSKFDNDVKHLWFNKDLHSQHYWEDGEQNLNHTELKIWSLTFPHVFHNICAYQKTYLSGWNKAGLITSVFPLLNHFVYKRIYNLILNDSSQDRYEKRSQANKNQNKNDFLRQILTNEKNLVEQLQLKCNPAFDNKFHPRIAFLGTASSMPTPSKNTLGIFVSLHKQINIILDCGQGTFQQLTDHLNPHDIQSQILKVRVIFITHIHSDHNLGILNFISQRNKLLKKHKKNQKIFLIIPFNVYNWYEQYNKTIEDLNVGCSVLFTQILENSNVESIKKEIQIMINKNAPKKGFFNSKKNIESDQKFCRNQTNILADIEQSAKTKQMVLQQLPYQLQVLRKFQYCLQNYGFKVFKPIKVIHCPQSYGIVIQSSQYKIGYSGDTRPAKEFQQAAKNCNLMIHQATFNDKDQSKASQFLHSTVYEAIQVGKKAKASKLALTHYNQDFQYPQAINYEPEYKKYFQENTIFSLDHLNLHLDSPMDQLPPITQFIMRADIESTNKAQKLKQSKNQ